MQYNAKTKINYYIQELHASFALECLDSWAPMKEALTTKNAAEIKSRGKECSQR